MKSIKELQSLSTATLPLITTDEKSANILVRVGLATCGIAAGAKPVYHLLCKLAAESGADNITVSPTGCVGICRYEPIVEIYQKGRRTTYIKVDTAKAEEIFNKHIKGGKPVEKYFYTEADGSKTENLTESAFYKKQKRIALKNCGVINPEKIEDYIAFGGYRALAKALTEMTPSEVVEVIKASGLRGRGGGGFPTGLKWQFSAQAQNETKYVMCNADEGDPGAFMDRAVLEGDPHSVLEAMAIAAYAVGAKQGYVYVRAEYPVAVERLNIAVKQAKEYGLLGKGIFGTDFDFELEIRLGAGAFVCGEETALMTSVEGHRGEPRPRPPFPAYSGLYQKPTLLNNVETYANIAQIILNGADWFASMGTEKSKGTKVFALGGKIANTGLVEIPMGTTLREVIYDIGGGIPDGKTFKAAQTGGPSGGCIPAALIDTPIDYDNLTAIGSMMGSGGLIVMDEDNCMVDIAKFFLDFTLDESCGKCTPCRIGNKRLNEMLTKVTCGEATTEDLEKMKELAVYVKADSLCGLGQSAPNPVLSTMNYFMDEYISHVQNRKCPAGVCKPLIKYVIDAEKCIGCNICARNCSANAIRGTLKQPHQIDMSMCVKCGICLTKCKFNAIKKV